MKSALRFVCLIFALLFCLTACSKSEFEIYEEIPEDIRGQTRIEVKQRQKEIPFVSLELLLKDAFGAPLADKALTCTVRSEKAEYVTDKDGIAVFAPSLDAGSYDVVVGFAGDETYRPSTVRTTLIVENRVNRSGIYVRANEMRTVDLDALKEQMIGHLFLHEDAVELYGSGAVETFIADALERGIKTHIWVLGLFDNNRWVNPINAATGEYNTDYFNKKAEEIRRIASLGGLYGIHFDCTRFEGGERSRADRYTSGGEPAGEKAVTEFVNTMRRQARQENSALVFSGTLMPDPGEAVSRYGQDVAALSQYFSFFVPMTYVGVYLNDINEITERCSAFASLAGTSEIWAGITGYDGDETQIALDEATVRSFADAGYAGGALGAVLFRYGKADIGRNRGKDLVPLLNLEPQAVTLY